MNLHSWLNTTYQTTRLPECEWLVNGSINGWLLVFIGWLLFFLWLVTVFYWWLLMVGWFIAGWSVSLGIVTVVRVMVSSSAMLVGGGFVHGVLATGLFLFRK